MPKLLMALSKPLQGMYLVLLLGLPCHKVGFKGRVQKVQPEGVLRRAPAVGRSVAAQGAVRVAAVPCLPPLKRCPLPALPMSIIISARKAISQVALLRCLGSLTFFDRCQKSKQEVT